MTLEYERTLRRAVFHYFERDDSTDDCDEFAELLTRLISNTDLMRGFAIMLVEAISGFVHAGEKDNHSTNERFH